MRQEAWIEDGTSSARAKGARLEAEVASAAAGIVASVDEQRGYALAIERSAESASGSADMIEHRIGRVAHTVYHPAGTTKMGDLNKDPNAVVDPELKIKGLQGIRIADAGVFPEMPSINPMLTVLAIGERAAEMIAQQWGWKGMEKQKL